MLQQQVGIFCAWWYWILTRKCPQFIGNRTETPSGKVILPDHSAGEMPGCVTWSIWSPSACNYYYDPICPSRASSSVLFRSKQKMFKLKITLNSVCFLPIIPTRLWKHICKCHNLRAILWRSCYYFARSVMTKYYKLGGFNTDMHCLTVLVAGPLRPGCWQGLFLWRALRKNLGQGPTPSFCGWLARFGIFWFVEASPRSLFLLHMPFSLCVYLGVQIFLFSRTNHIVLEPPLLQCDLVTKYICTDPNSNYSRSQRCGLSTSTSCEDTIQSITVI